MQSSPHGRDMRRDVERETFFFSISRGLPAIIRTACLAWFPRLGGFVSLRGVRILERSTPKLTSCSANLENEISLDVRLRVENPLFVGMCAWSLGIKLSNFYPTGYRQRGRWRYERKELVSENYGECQCSWLCYVRSLGLYFVSLVPLLLFSGLFVSAKRYKLKSK